MVNSRHEWVKQVCYVVTLSLAYDISPNLWQLPGYPGLLAKRAMVLDMHTPCYPLFGVSPILALNYGYSSFCQLVHS